MVNNKPENNSEAAVLFITYSRPEYARKSFDAIKKAKPGKLYFYSNKASEGNQDELTKNNEIRSFINEVDWDCELKTFFREKHVEIYTSLYSAIDWVFDNEEKAIILEEDCVASIAFFDYCNKLLNYYKDEQKVWMISGDNFTPEGNPDGYTYFFSRYGHIYGWASWADRWKNQDRKLKTFPELRDSNHFFEYYGNKRKAKFFLKRYNSFYKILPKRNPWDGIKSYNMILTNSYSIIPYKNLVSNIGVVGHHNDGKVPSRNFNLEVVESATFTINNIPDKIEPNAYDDYHFQHHYWLKRSTIVKKIKNRINKAIRIK